MVQTYNEPELEFEFEHGEPEGAQEDAVYVLDGRGDLMRLEVPDDVEDDQA